MTCPHLQGGVTRGDKDGAMLARVANKAAWEATLVKYCDIGCRKPRGQVEMYGITEY